MAAALCQSRAKDVENEIMMSGFYLRKAWQSLKNAPWFWGTVLAGLSLRLGLALAPLRFMLDFTLPDDAFYYFVIARNMALGRGISFDGMIPTNGFHPLWGLLITPVYLSGVDGEPAIRLILALGAYWIAACQEWELTGPRVAKVIMSSAGSLAVL